MDDELGLRKEKLSQNIQALVGEIGERQVLLRLAILCHQTEWEVFHNLGDAGYDILLMNVSASRRIKIEVKAHQNLYTTGKIRSRVHFFLTDGEYKACDFLVAFFIDQNSFFVIPKEVLKKVTVNGNIRWRYSMPVYKDKSLHKSEQKYLDAWGTLDPGFEH